MNTQSETATADADQLGDDVLAQLLTAPQLCRELGIGYDSLDHAVKRHGPKPIGRVGSTRVWSRSQFRDVLAAVARCRADRTREFPAQGGRDE